MQQTNSKGVPYRAGLPEVPYSMRHLPVDKRGFPVPWFTPMVNGEWNFQAVAHGKPLEAYSRDICWICGKPNFPKKSFVIGPMCAINHTTSEPGSHPSCAEFAAKACPFLTKPRMRRATREGGLTAGIMIERNPGVCLVWTTKPTKLMPLGAKPIRVKPGGPGQEGILFSLANPVKVKAYSEGRPAKDEEVIASIETGLPNLLHLCETKGDYAEIERRLKQAWKILKLPMQIERDQDAANATAA